MDVVAYKVERKHLGLTVVYRVTQVIGNELMEHTLTWAQPDISGHAHWQIFPDYKSATALITTEKHSLLPTCVDLYQW